MLIVSHSPVILAEIQMPVMAGSAGAALTLVVKQCGFRFQWCGTLRVHHTHKDPVPRLGGIAVFLAIVIACILAEVMLGHRAFAPALPILFASVPVLLVGSYDDIRHASPKSKVLAQLAGAALLIAAHWISKGTVDAYELLLLPVWLVVTTNSFNLIDGLDGLASGTAVVIGLGLAMIHLTVGNFALGALSIITAAACLGFLPFNLIGPRIFLGDSGSLTIGFILAALAFETPRGSHLPWTALLLFGYPLSETALTVVRRALKGRILFRPDREHLHHKLRHSRLSVAQATLLLWMFALAFVSLGVALGLGASRWLTVGAGGILFLAAAKSFGYLSPRKLTLLRRRLALHQRRQEGLPDIAGYLPFK